MKPGDLIVTKHARVASWYPGMISKPRLAFQNVDDGTVMLLLAVHSTTVLTLSDRYGLTHIYIKAWDGPQAFEVVS